MSSCYSGAIHFARYHIHTDKTTMDDEEPQQKYLLGTASNKCMDGFNLFLYDAKLGVHSGWSLQQTLYTRVCYFTNGNENFRSFAFLFWRRRAFSICTIYVCYLTRSISTTTTSTKKCFPPSWKILSKFAAMFLRK